MEHLNVTFPHTLKHRLDRQAKIEHTKRSTLIQKAVAIYLELIEKEKLWDSLKEGYLEMAGESMKLLDEFHTLDKESLKYVD